MKTKTVSATKRETGQHHFADCGGHPRCVTCGADEDDAYVGGEKCTYESEPIKPETQLCYLPPSFIATGGEIDRLAVAAGYTSGLDWANSGNQWTTTLAEAREMLKALSRDNANLIAAAPDLLDACKCAEAAFRVPAGTHPDDEQRNFDAKASRVIKPKRKAMLLKAVKKNAGLYSVGARLVARVIPSFRGKRIRGSVPCTWNDVASGKGGAR